MSEMTDSAIEKEQRTLNMWGRGKLSQIERNTAFIIAVMKIHEKGLSGIGIEANLGLGISIEKNAERYHAVAMLETESLVVPVRIELDKKMYEDYLSGKLFNTQLNYEDYE